MCGPSQSEKNLQASEASFDQTLQQDYSTTFAQNQDILNSLNSVLQPIVQAGPNQQGYSPQELAALNTQAIESNAQGYQQVAQATGQQEAAAGGGKTFLPSGVNAQINAAEASAAESNLSNENLGITTSNYAQGRANWQQALSGEESVAAGESPVAYAGATTNANQAAFGEANTINQQSNAEFGQILGGIEGIGSAAVGGIENLDTTGGSTGLEQVGNFLSGLGL